MRNILTTELLNYIIDINKHIYNQALLFTMFDLRNIFAQLFSFKEMDEGQQHE